MKGPFPRDSAPYPARSVPFRDESEVRNFVEKYAEKILGLTVISCDRIGGGQLLEIDVLAVNAANTPFIIECKWDVVGAKALRQLARYKEALYADWHLFRRHVIAKRGKEVQIRKRDPVLIALGYRYDPSVLADPQSVVCLTYAYARLVHTDKVIDRFRRGEVCIQRADPAILRPPLHPRIIKTRAYTTVKSIDLLPRALQKAFYKVDEEVRRLEGVTVTYGGRSFARYRVPRGNFAEATVGPHSIQWSFARTKPWASGRLGSVEMLAASDAGRIFDVIRGAYERQPNKTGW